MFGSFPIACYASIYSFLSPLDNSTAYRAFFAYEINGSIPAGTDANLYNLMLS